MLVVCMLLGIAACGPPDDQETGSIRGQDVREAREDLPPALVEALDSGNAAYRRGDYDVALEFYNNAVDIDDDVAAGWFGVYMAELALGHPEAADSAMMRAQDLAPGASLIHPERDTTP
jgi:tetratricopeptide (TPR) repeat protein